MKLPYIVPRVAIAAVSIALGLVVLTSVVPLFSGGLSIGVTPGGSGLSMEINDVNMRIKGDYTVTSTLPYDINDAYLRIELGEPGGATITLYDESDFDLPKNSSRDIALNEEVFLPTLLLMGFLGHDSGKLGVPATIYVGGSYLERMTGIGIDVDMLINITGEETSGLVKNATAKGNGDYSDFEFGIEAPGILFPADGTSIEAKFGTTTITLTRSGDAIAITGVSTGEGIIDDVKNTGTVQVTGHGPISVTEEQMADFAGVLSELLGECA